MSNIFLSHKAKDGEVASKIKSNLHGWFAADVFLSSDAESLRGGDQWRETIHSALKSSSWLVLLYSDARENWDWCIYEGAYFLGHHADRASGKLTILHPEGTSPPNPFDAWQRVRAVPKSVEGWLRNAFPQNSTSQIPPDAAYKSAAADIAVSVQSLAIRPYVADRLLQVHVSAAQANEPERDLSVDVMLKRATFKVDAGAGFILQTRADVEIEGEAFQPTLEACRFDVQGLCDAVNAVRKRSLGSSQVLDLFRSTQDARAYRPVITKADRTDGGAIDIELMLAEIPPTFEYKTCTGFDTMFHLLAVTARFRWEVAEVFAPQVEAAAKSGNPVAIRALLQNLLRAVTNVRNDALNRALTMDKVLDALPKKNHQKRNRRRFASAHEAAQEAMKILEKAVRESDLSSAVQSLLILRLANYEFLDVTVTALSGLIEAQQLPPIDSLDTTMKKLIPRGIRQLMRSKSFSSR